MCSWFICCDEFFSEIYFLLFWKFFGFIVENIYNSPREGECGEIRRKINYKF